MSELLEKVPSFELLDAQKGAHFGQESSPKITPVLPYSPAPPLPRSPTP